MLREDRDPSLQNQLALSLSSTIAGASGSALLEEKELGSWGTQRCAQTPRARRVSARARAGPVRRLRENPDAELARAPQRQGVAARPPLLW